MHIHFEPSPAQLPSQPPAADEVRVWIVPLDTPPLEPADLLASLTPEERDRAERYRSLPVRHQFVTGRAMLRRILGAYLDMRPHSVPITYTAAGKPILVGEELHFNLTHTTGLALIAVGRNRVGIDVEGVREVPGMDGLVERFFSMAERSAFRELPERMRPRAFFRGWTCKEAVIKAAGATVQCLDAFDVELDPERPPAVLAIREAALAAAGWAMAHWSPTAGYVAAIAVEGDGPVRIDG